MLNNAPASGSYRREGILATVNGVPGPDHIAQQPEAVKQVAVADRIAVTKYGRDNAEPLTKCRRDDPYGSFPIGSLRPTSRLHGHGGHCIGLSPLRLRSGLGSGRIRRWRSIR